MIWLKHGLSDFKGISLHHVNFGAIWNLRLCHRQSCTNFQGLENWWWEYSVAVDGPNLRYLFNSFFLFFGVIPSCAGFCPSTAISGQHEDSYIFLSRRARLSIFFAKKDADSLDIWNVAAGPASTHSKIIVGCKTLLISDVFVCFCHEFKWICWWNLFTRRIV